jgi:hypothetical protein
MRCGWSGKVTERLPEIGARCAQRCARIRPYTVCSTHGPKTYPSCSRAEISRMLGHFARTCRRTVLPAVSPHHSLDRCRRILGSSREGRRGDLGAAQLCPALSPACSPNAQPGTASTVSLIEPCVQISSTGLSDSLRSPAHDKPSEYLSACDSYYPNSLGTVAIQCNDCNVAGYSLTCPFYAGNVDFSRIGGGDSGPRGRKFESCHPDWKTWAIAAPCLFDSNSSDGNNQEATNSYMLGVSIHDAGEGPEDSVKLETKAPIMQEGTVCDASGVADLPIPIRSTSGASAAAPPAARIKL